MVRELLDRSPEFVFYDESMGHGKIAAKILGYDEESIRKYILIDHFSIYSKDASDRFFNSYGRFPPYSRIYLFCVRDSSLHVLKSV